MLWSPSVSFMFFTLVPALIGLGAPFTGRSLISTTVSPSWSTLPLASFTINTSVSVAALAVSVCSSGFHSWPHSGHIMDEPVGYPYGDWHLGHWVDSGMFKSFREGTQVLGKFGDRCRPFNHHRRNTGLGYFGKSSLP